MSIRRPRFTPFSAFIILGVALLSATWTILAVAPPEMAPYPLQPEIFLAETTFADVVTSEHEYVEVMDSCGPYFGGECLTVRAGLGEDYRTIGRLRKGAVLKVEPVFNGLSPWYRILFDEPLRYPERVSRKQYIAGTGLRHFYGRGVEELGQNRATSTKRIVVDRFEQKLSAYEGEERFMEVSVSTGIELTPTPRGIFKIYKKTPTRYMQGPLPGISTKYYDLPGVPWNLYFTKEGGVIHGAYWHDKFGRRWSNGCVNLPLDEARRLYEWAEIGTEVLVKG